MKSIDNEKEIAHFYTSKELFPLALGLFDEQRRLILGVSPRAIVTHIGATSIPEALTIGDLDIHVQVSDQDFFDTTEKLKDHYHINHIEMWTDKFALFHRKDHTKMPMSIIVVVKGSDFDEHALQTDLLRNDPNLLLEYNNLKRRFEGKPVVEYKKAKREFFGPNGKSILLKDKSI